MDILSEVVILTINIHRQETISKAQSVNEAAEFALGLPSCRMEGET